MLLGCCVLAALAAGCEKPPATVPVSVKGYDQLKASNSKAFPDPTILQYNQQRALDSSLKPQDRVESLQLVMRLGAGDPQILDQLASVLGDPNSPEIVRTEILTVLLAKNYPGMGRHVVKALPNLKPGTPLREQVLEWLKKNPDKADLSDIVRLWALEPVDGPDEARFRIIVERMTNRRWEDALLDGINAPGQFYARGSAMEVLAHRPNPSKSELAKKILALTPATTAMAALKTFVGAFGYLPADGRDLLVIATLFRNAPTKIGPAAKLYQQWRTDFGYSFALRDFHLLSRLSEDSSRRSAPRADLVLKIAQALEGRQHVRHVASARGAADDYVDNFSAHVGSLSMADLWNLYLLNEMLSLPRIQQAMHALAQRDRKDTTSAWGGLVFYENGQAAAKLYPPAEGSSDDSRYRPSELLDRDGHDALCRFLCHFDKVYNNEHVGPDAAELADARNNDCYGLVLTSVSEFAFCAHYYTPQGVVVSLGKFPFRE